METIILEIIIKVLLLALTMVVWLFFAIHAMQYIASPMERTFWFCFFIMFFYLAPFIYYFVRWRHFKQQGCGKLMVK